MTFRFDSRKMNYGNIYNKNLDPTDCFVVFYNGELIATLELDPKSEKYVKYRTAKQAVLQHFQTNKEQ